VDDLIGAAEIAERLGWSHSRSVHTIRRRLPEFPQPVATLRQAMVWAWPDVETSAWATGLLK
jgi:hypothetical protein